MKKKVIKAVVVGFLGSIAICGISDIFLPFLGGTLLGIHMHLHICLIEHWWLSIPFAVFGILIAVFLKGGTKAPHSIHVLISTMATLLYLISFGFPWPSQLFAVFIIVFLGVAVPCCTSDIIFPILASSSNAK